MKCCELVPGAWLWVGSRIASKYQTWTKVSKHTKVLSGKVSITPVEHFILQALDVSMKTHSTSLIGFNITVRFKSTIKPKKNCLSLTAVDFSPGHLVPKDFYFWYWLISYPFFIYWRFLSIFLCYLSPSPIQKTNPLHGMGISIASLVILELLV